MQDEYFTDRVYQQYYDEVGKHPIINAVEERALLLRYHSCPRCKQKIPQKIKTTNCPDCGSLSPENAKGRDYHCSECSAQFPIHTIPTMCPRCGVPRDMDARHKLIVSNLRFVIRRAKRYSKKPEHIRKLISAGNVGLMVAIDKFNTDRNTRFLTYAEWWIRKEMLDEMHASNLVHVPTHKQKTLRREQKEGKYICDHCGIRTDSLTSVDYLISCTEDAHDFRLPLNNYVGALGDAVPIETTVLQTADDTEELIVGSSTNELLREALHTLPLRERDRFILTAYYNVACPDRQCEAKTLPQLAAITGITPERVRQIKEQTLEFLRKELRRMEINSVTEVCT